MIKKSARFTRAIVTSLSEMTTLQSFACIRRPVGGALRTAKRLQKLLCEIFSASRRLRAAIVPSDVAAQPFLSRDAQRLRLASPPDVRAVFAVPQTGKRAGSWAGARRCFALLVLRTDP